MSFNSFSIVLLAGGFITLLITIVIFKKLGGPPRWWGAVMLGISLWALSYGLELSSSSLEEMLFWINIEYVGISLLPAIWIIFVVKFIGKEHWLTWKNYIFLFGPGIITLLLVWTKNYNHLHYAELDVDQSGAFPLLSIKPGPWYKVHTLYFYTLLAAGTYLLIAKFKMALSIYRRQIYLIVASALIPWLINIIYLFNIRPLKHIDLTPFAFVISAIVIGVGLLKFDLFNIVPIAREKVFESLEDGVLVLNEFGKIVDHNKAVIKIFNNPFPKLVGLPIQQLLVNQPEILNIITLRDEKANEEALTQMELDQLFYSVIVTPLFNKQQHFGGSIIIFRNITKLKKIEQRLRDQTEELIGINKIKDKIFSIVAHDLRSPLINLNEILSMTNMGLVNPDELAEMLPLIQKDIQATSGFLENLLHWSKSQLQGQTIHAQNFNIAEVVNTVAELFASIASEKRVTIKNNITESNWVYADKNMIQLVVRNLISNAIKFCNSNDEICISTSSNELQTTICVKDTGLGISTENQTKLFNLNNFTTKGSKNEVGTGLGLVLCKEFTEKNGGKIWVESEEGKGSKFCFTIPNGIAV